MKQLTKEQNELKPVVTFIEDYEETKAKVDKILNSLPKLTPQVSVDRLPEETTSEYMDRVATINGRK